MKAFFVSDIHIRSEEKTNGLKFLQFLKTLPQDTTHLILLGDIFDLWVGSHQYFIKKYPKILSEFKKLIDRDVEIHYFEGNHDIHLKEYFCDKLGMYVHANEYFFNFGGLHVRAEHGDLMNKEDKGYLFLRNALRSFPMNLIATKLPGIIVQAVGDRSSKVSRFYTDRMNQQYKDKVIKFTRDYAEQIYALQDFDLIVTGHTHVDDDYTFEKSGKKIRSMNLGSWLDRPKTLMVTPTEQKILDI